jgi:hypothetical protein
MFYKLHTTRDLVEPIAMIVRRKSDTFQKILIYVMATGYILKAYCPVCGKVLQAARHT